MAGGASIAVVGVILSTAALAMVILIYARPEVIGISEPEAERKAAKPEEATAEKRMDGDGKNMMMGKTGEDAEGKASRRIYTFSYENYEAPYNYIDKDGNLTGVMMDLVEEACKRAGQQCVHMYMGKSGAPCWDGETYRGLGLDRMYYDACVTWSITRKRTNTFQFTTPLMAQNFYSIYASDSTKTFSMLTQEKFGFVKGWALDAACIKEELTLTIPKENIVTLLDLESAKNKLRSGEISFAALPSGIAEFTSVASQLKCGRLGGYSIMTRYDSHIPLWFDKVFKQMTEDGTYKDICEGAEEKYGKAADCL